MQRFQFSKPPEIQLTVRGDAQPHEEIVAELKIQAPAARSPHADWRNLTVLGEVQRVRGTNNQLTASPSSRPITRTAPRGAGSRWPA